MFRLRQAAFMGRDCLLVNHGKTAHKVHWLPGALEAMLMLQRTGHELIMVIDQPGLATGKVRSDAHWAWAAAVRLQLHDVGIRLAGMLLCPHDPEGHVAPYNIACDCRKPEPGLLLRAANTLSLNLGNSVVFAADEADLVRGQRAGVSQLVLIQASAPRHWVGKTLFAPTLLDAVQTLRRGPLEAV